MIEAFRGPNSLEVGEAVLRTIAAGSRRGADITATLVDSTVRRDPAPRVQVCYYKLEFQVESPSFCRHNVAVCCAYGGKLFTLSAQAAESKWQAVREELCTIADSFRLTPSPDNLFLPVDFTTHPPVAWNGWGFSIAARC